MKWSLKSILTPYWLLLLPVLFSFLGWILPWEGARKGFALAEPITVPGATFLLAWYGSVFTAAVMGFRLGVVSSPRERLQAMPDDLYYRWFTVLAVVGVAYSYLYVVWQDPSILTSAFSNATFNDVRFALPYGPGLHTLRYSTVLAGGIALYFLSKRELRRVHFVNVGLLFANAAIASRLSVVLAALVAVGLVAQRRPDYRPKVRSVLLLLAVFFLVMTPLNYLRNAGFYRTQYGTSNPLVMNAYEILSYLGAPFQGSLGVSNDWEALGEPPPGVVPVSVARYTVPEYIPLDLTNASQTELRYRTYVDIEPELTTNSALASMYSALGLSAFLLATGVAFFASLLAGHASRYRSFFFLVQFIVGYAFAEFWRTYLFNAGILHFLVLVLLVLPFLPARVRNVVLGRRPRPHPASIDTTDHTRRR